MGPAAVAQTGILLAVVAFAALCVLVLRASPSLVEPDDYAYRASITAITDGHLLTLSAAQVHALSAQLASAPGGPGSLGPGGPIIQWVRLPGGRWISEKDPGYPFLAAPFQLLGIIRLAPLGYAALGCLGLFAGARRWLGQFGAGAAVGLFCSSGAALLFAWRDYMPTFTDASLIAAGTGALLWVVLADEATPARRTWAGLAGFVALAAAVSARYTDIVVVGCAVVAMVVAWRLRKVPGTALAWWLGSVAVSGAGIALFDSLVYGGPFRSGYRPGVIRFSLSAIAANVWYLPGHLAGAMPMLVLGLVAVGWITVRWLRRRHAGEALAGPARRDLAVGLALAASWASVWGLYATYTWTAAPGLNSLQAVRFYVPALGAISLLSAWLLVQVPRRAALPGLTSAAVVAAAFGLGVWSYNSMRSAGIGGPLPIVQGHRPVIGRPGARNGPGPAPGGQPPVSAVPP